MVAKKKLVNYQQYLLSFISLWIFCNLCFDISREHHWETWLPSPWVSTAFGLVHPSRVSRQLQKAHQSSALKNSPKHQNGKGWKYKTPSCWLLYNGDIMDMNGELYWYIGTCHLLPCGMLCCSITSVVPLGFNYVKKSSESANHCNWRSQQTFLQHLPGLRSTCNGPPWHQGIIVVSTRHHTKHCAIQANGPLDHESRRKPDWHIEWGFPDKHTVLRWRSTTALTDSAVCWNPLKGPAFGSKRHGRGWHYLRIEVENIRISKFCCMN